MNVQVLFLRRGFLSSRQTPQVLIPLRQTKQRQTSRGEGSKSSEKESKDSKSLHHGGGSTKKTSCRKVVCDYSLCGSSLFWLIIMTRKSQQRLVHSVPNGTVVLLRSWTVHGAWGIPRFCLCDEPSSSSSSSYLECYIHAAPYLA